MGTIDNIYALNYLINRQIEKKGGKLMAMFVDLRAAFDSVNRDSLVDAMRERGVRERLVRGVERILRETKCRVKVGGKEGNCFWMARGVRQGCPLSLLLFNILLADLEEEMGKVRWGGVKLDGKRVYTLAYADDMVLLAEGEEEMKSMMERLEIYLDKKKVELNAEKTKMLRFRREEEERKRRIGGGRERELKRSKSLSIWDTC